jgi:hypothetical protein
LNPSNSRQIVQALDTSSNLGVSNTVNIIGYRINFTDELSKMIEFGELARDQIQFIGTQNAIKYLNSCSYRFKGANDVVFSLSSNHLGGDDSCQ